MNIRQQKYKQNRLKGMSAYRSAIDAGYAHNTALNASKNIEKRGNFSDLMKAYGLDDDSLMMVLRNGLKNENMAGFPNLTAKAFLEIALKLNGRLKEQEQKSNKTIVNVYPNKTLVFTDYDDSDNTDTKHLHASQSEEGSRIEGKI